ncbi:MAG: hypothetical protein KGL43_17115 [Burkholderiales bacterium]|nr:hypothetical protein [Burkholderiales bacterium]MDE2455309.1 hypothetical protein [Burkholderiales bacterium]
MITARRLQLDSNPAPTAAAAWAFGAPDEAFIGADAAPARQIDTASLTRGETVMVMPADGGDAMEPILRAEHADWMLLRLVVCAGLATLLLALASSLGH